MGASREQRNVVNRNARPKVLYVYVSMHMFVCTQVLCVCVCVCVCVYACVNECVRARRLAFVFASIFICSYRRQTAEKLEVLRNRLPRLAPLQQRPRRSYRHECERVSQCVCVRARASARCV